MPTRFTGVLSRVPAEGVAQGALKPRHAIRPLPAREVGCVLNMPSWQPARDMLEPYLGDLGMQGTDWVFLAYEEWNGPVDYFQRYGQIGDDRLESIAHYDQKAQRLYLDLMDRFGLGHLAEGFEPLSRGYWG